MKRIVLFLLPALFCIASVNVNAQKFNALDLAKAHIRKQLPIWQLSEADVRSLSVSDHYQTKHNGVTHLYFQQQYQGIPVYNALTGIHVRPEGEALDLGHRFVKDLEKKINTTTPIHTPLSAIQAVAKYLDMTPPNLLGLEKEVGRFAYRYSKGQISRSAIPVRLVYFPTSDEKVLLSWEVQIDDPRADNYWIVQLDAVSGEVIDKLNQTIHCTFGENPYGHINETEAVCNDPLHAAEQHLAPTFFDNAAESRRSIVTRAEGISTTQNTLLPSNNVGAIYNVFPMPVESPSHGNRALLADPADPMASPFGWHDTDGVAGAEHTTTRGNNANTVFNRQNSTGASGNEPDGGESLNFDFPYNANNEPFQNAKAATTNLFYVTNFMHDFTYHYGFDEAAGNYQVKNYTGQGKEGDPVLSVTQYGANIPATPNDNNPNNDYINNANFTPLPDGARGTSRMYAWNRSASGAKSLQVQTPLTIAGSYEADLANFGTALTETGISGEIVELDNIVNASNNVVNHLACELPDNTDELNGKIALIDRGNCDFSKKVFNAQQAGAIAAIICNFEDALIGGMGAGDNATQVTIPSIFVKRGDCAAIRGFLGTEPVTISMLNPPTTGPDSLDGSFDNGIIAHEYAHGVSNRLTGGPNTASCLRDFGNDGEQMGEGWSDFFTLVSTIREGDTKETKRGIGTFVYRQDKNGQGVRDYPYSTNMAVNPLTYESIILDGIPYGTGAVWASALWDMYWAFVEAYDWSADLYTGNKGNNIAIQLVMDAMKMQPCDPSMVEGRDAILMADQINNNGANACLIWEVFAARGIGFEADAGNIATRFDNTQSFDLLPSCVATVKVEKTVTPLIEAGAEIEVTLIVRNDKPVAATSVKINDEIPAGATFLPGSANKAFTLEGGMINFEMASLGTGVTDTIRYKLTSSADIISQSIFYDDMEDGEDNWFHFFTEEVEGVKNDWGIDDIFANSGDKAWAVNDIGQRSRAYLQFDQPVQLVGNQPAIRFFHKYDTEPGRDGGFVELSIDGGNTWFDAKPYLIRNPYRGPITYTTFAIPNLRAFWGKSDDFVESYIDLSAFQGKDLMMQFSFATDAEIGGTGWFVDDVEIMDLKNYNGQVCVTTAEGDNVCTSAADKGTIVLPGESTPTVDPDDLSFSLQVFPNPAKDLLHLNINSTVVTDYQVQLISLDGKLMKEQKIIRGGLRQVVPMSVSDLPAGFYFVKMSTKEGTISKKVIVQE